MEALQHLFQNLENEPESIQEEASLIAKEIQETDQVIQEKTQKSNQKLLLMGFALAVVALVTLLQSVGLFHFQGLIALGIGLSIAAIFMTLNTLQKQPVQAYKKQLKDLEKKLNNRAAKYRAKKVESTEPTSNLDDIFQFLFGGKKQKSSRNSLTQTKGPFKSRKDKVISGVIGGLAQSWGVNPFYLRLIVLCLIPFTSGIIIPIYIASSLLMPKEPTIE